MNRTIVTAAITIATTRAQLSARGRGGDVPADALCFVSDLVHEGRNENHDIFSRAEMERAWPTLIWTPFDKDHDFKVDGTVGGLYDAAFEVRNNRAVIRVAGFVHRGFYPDVAWKIECELINAISMETAFDEGIRTREGRRLVGVEFIGGGLTRMPADPEAYIDRTGDRSLRAAAHRRRALILRAALLAAGERAA